MKDFADIAYTSGSFPDVTATDASNPSLRNGTPLTADFMTDIFGMVQAILNSAGITPSGSAETSSVSDVLEGIQRVAGHPGEVVYWAGAASPDARLIQLAGQTITAANYPDLVTATYIGDGNNADTDYEAFYKCSDEDGLVRNPAGPYFKLPDCRGYFLRGLDDGSGNDLGRSDFSVGKDDIQASTQEQSYGQHTHVVDPGVVGLDYFVSEEVGIIEGTTASTYNLILRNKTSGVDFPYSYSAKYVPTYVAGYPFPSNAIDTYYPQELPTDEGEEENRPANIAFRVMMRY